MTQALSQKENTDSIACKPAETPLFYLFLRFVAPVFMSAYYALERRVIHNIDDVSFLLLSHGVSFLLTLSLVLGTENFSTQQNTTPPSNKDGFSLWRGLDADTCFWIMARTMSVFITAWSFQKTTRNMPVYIIGFIKCLKPFIVVILGLLFFKNKIYFIDILAMILMTFIIISSSGNGAGFAGFDVAPIYFIYPFLGVLAGAFCEFVMKKMTLKKSDQISPLRFSCLISMGLVIFDIILWMTSYSQKNLMCDKTGLYYGIICGFLHSMSNFLLIINIKSMSLVSYSLIGFSSYIWVFIMGALLTHDKPSMSTVMNGLFIILINICVILYKNSEDQNIQTKVDIKS